MPVAECPECEGRGWVLTGSGAGGTARRCRCRLVSSAPRLLELAGLPTRYRQCRLSTFQVDGADGLASQQLLRVRSTCERYVEEFLEADGRFRESGLLLIGPPGVGKTHLAAAVLMQVIENYGVRGCFVDFTRLVHDIQSTFGSASATARNEILDPVRRAELLVLDELGAQKPTAWVSDLLYLIMNSRYAERLPTVFTTNFALTDEVASLDRGSGLGTAPSLASRIPATLVSRLYEMAKPIEIDAVGDYRREIRMHQHRA